MATESKTAKFDFSKDECALIHSALVLKSAQLDRAIRAEVDPVVRERRVAVATSVDELAKRIAMGNLF